MNWTELAYYAAGGALAGAVGWLLNRFVPRNRDILRVAIPSGLVATAMVIVETVVLPPVRARATAREITDSAMSLFGDATLADLYTSRLVTLVKDPHLKQRAQEAAVIAGLPPGAEKESVIALSFVGMARLSPAELVSSMALRHRLAEISRPVCVGLWKGGVQPEALTAALRSLTPAEKRTWIEITTNAAMLQLQATSPPKALSNADVMGAWITLMAQLPAADRDLFDRVSKAGASVNDDDACNAFRVLSATVKSLPPGERDTMIRSITCPFLVSNTAAPAAAPVSPTNANN